MFKLSRQCCAQARGSGKRCSITEESRATKDGVLAAKSLQNGCRQCLFHLDLFVGHPAKPPVPVIVCYLDFETTGLSVTSDNIVEFGLLSHRCMAAFSSVVRPPSLPSPCAMVHGIDDAELEQGPPFNVVFARCIDFLENLLVTCATDLDSSDEELDFQTHFEQQPHILLCCHNLLKFDAPFLISEAIRNDVPVLCFENWYFVDTLDIFRLVADLVGGCVKLQCLRNCAQKQNLAAHRALDESWNANRQINQVPYMHRLYSCMLDPSSATGLLRIATSDSLAI
jgi:inhibitor of KinA sporulation pathway (predicted exonuclease)